MSILIDETTQVVVQGITGREGRTTALLMRDYGTQVVAGVTPGRGGMLVEGIPVYNTVEEAVENHPGITASTILAPARFAKSAAFEAIAAGVKLIALHPERIPQQDMLEVFAYSRQKGSIVVGPNTPGVISPGRCLVGMLGYTADFARQFFTPGRAGVLSRSGGTTTTLCYYLTCAGIGQSTVFGIGGDANVGSNWADLLPYFEADDGTDLVVGYGEIGTTMEEDAAELVRQKRFTKPLIVYVSGVYARPGVRFGHAGAIIERGQGSALGKIQALRDAGAIVVDHLHEVGEAAKRVIGERSH